MLYYILYYKRKWICAGTHPALNNTLIIIIIICIREFVSYESIVINIMKLSVFFFNNTSQREVMYITFDLNLNLK